MFAFPLTRIRKARADQGFSTKMEKSRKYKQNFSSVTCSTLFYVTSALSSLLIVQNVRNFVYFHENIFLNLLTFAVR